MRKLAENRAKLCDLQVNRDKLSDKWSREGTATEESLRADAKIASEMSEVRVSERAPFL
jgi:hypothetical protein